MSVEKTYQFGDNHVFREACDLLEQGSGEGRYMKARKMLYGLVSRDFEEPGGGLSVQKKEGHYEITCGGYAKLELDVNPREKTMSVTGKEKEK